MPTVGPTARESGLVDLGSPSPILPRILRGRRPAAPLRGPMPKPQSIRTAVRPVAGSRMVSSDAPVWSSSRRMCSAVRSTIERLAPVSRRRSTGISPVTSTSQWVGAPGRRWSARLARLERDPTRSAGLLDDAAFERTGDECRWVSLTERQFAAAEPKPDLGLDEAIDRDGECFDGSRSRAHPVPLSGRAGTAAVAPANITMTKGAGSGQSRSDRVEERPGPCWPARSPGRADHPALRIEPLGTAEPWRQFVSCACVAESPHEHEGRCR